MPDNILTPAQTTHILEIPEDARWRRLEVDGHYLGKLDVVSGTFCLYYRGKTEWYSIEDERRKIGATEAQRGR